jgi:hypothetical protein
MKQLTIFAFSILLAINFAKASDQIENKRCRVERHGPISSIKMDDQIVLTGNSEKWYSGEGIGYELLDLVVGGQCEFKGVCNIETIRYENTVDSKWVLLNGVRVVFFASDVDKQGMDIIEAFKRTGLCY